MFFVSVLVLQADEDAQAFFHDKNTEDLKTLTAGRLVFFIPDSINDVFSEKGRARFPGLQRKDLSCLLAEQDKGHYFIVRLRNLTPGEIRDVLSDLGDAAEGKKTLEEWRQDFEQRQSEHKKTHALSPELGSKEMKPVDPRNPGNPPNDNNKLNNDGKADGQKGGSLLEKLGRIAGIGGIGAGVFVTLLGKFVFPQLTAQHATLLMFLTYGIAVVGLITWAAQVTTQKTLPLLLAVVSVVMAIIGWAVLRPGEVGYRIRVIVLSPSQTPLNEAHVSSTFGGETKKVEGGWEIDPGPDIYEHRTGTVYATVAEQGWRGKKDLTLDENHSPSITVPLAESGELEVRGTVVGTDGLAVSNAQVSVVGYGDEARPTNANGGFVLPAHAARGETIALHAEKGTTLVADYKDYKVGSGPVTLVLKTIQQAERETRKKPTAVAQKKTNDVVIDRVIANLAAFKQLQQSPTESQIASTLTPLFSRPAFYYGIREEDWRYFLYALCRTRLLLEEYIGAFKSKPDVRSNIDQAIQRMVTLENEIAKLYGPTFSLTEHIHRYIDDKNAFVNNLPALQANPTPDFFDARDKEIREIRSLLRAAGLVNDSQPTQP